MCEGEFKINERNVAMCTHQLLENYKKRTHRKQARCCGAPESIRRGMKSNGMFLIGSPVVGASAMINCHQLVCAHVAIFEEFVWVRSFSPVVFWEEEYSLMQLCFSI